MNKDKEKEKEEPIRPAKDWSPFRNFSSRTRTFRCKICNCLTETNHPNQKHTCGREPCVREWGNIVTKAAQKRSKEKLAKKKASLKTVS
jgi:hypothetical protein